MFKPLELAHRDGVLTLEQMWKLDSAVEVNHQLWELDQPVPPLNKELSDLHLRVKLWSYPEQAMFRA
jgi:hypothetical protein